MPDEILNSSERSEYRRLCKVIDEKLSSFVEVAEALKRIKDGKLYKAEFETFEAFCKEKYDIGKSYANKLISAAKVKESVEAKTGTRVPKIENEKQARELAKAPEEKQSEAWESAVEAAGGEQPTAAQVKEAVKEVVAETKPDPVKDETGHEVCGGLIVTFQNLEKFADFDKAIGSLMRQVDELGEIAGGEYVKPHAERIKSDLRKARVAVKESRPYAQCAKCKGKGCEHCKKFGYLLKSQWALKAESKGHKK